MVAKPLLLPMPAFSYAKATESKSQAALCHALRCCSAWRLLNIRSKLAATGALLLVFLAVDPPFLAYTLTICSLLAIDIMASLTKRRYAVAASLGGVLMATSVAYSLLRSLELPQPPPYTFNTDKTTLNASFFRIYDPKIGYMPKMSSISKLINGARDQEVQSLRVQGLEVWSSEILRFDFLLHYWSSKKMTAPFLCIMESDVAVDVAYFQQQMTSIKPQIGCVQHFWGHEDFEKFNIGVLCATKRPSHFTRLWTRLMRLLHAKRYRRLLPYALLWGILHQDLFVFKWDRHGGCTRLWGPHC
eukprot:scaffold299388_cov47-Prasinocladus_malaysianus.AAC.1